MGRTWRLALTFFGLVVFVAGAVAKDASAAPLDRDAVYKVTLQGNEPHLGPNDALVTVVEFGEFECPFTGRAQSTLKQLKQRYGNRIRIVWMNNPLPFHPNAMPAAKAALEAYAQKGNQGFWAMHDVLFANQRSLGRTSLEGYAQEMGLDMAKFRRALDSNKHESTIRRQQQLAKSLGAKGTPTFFVNGRPVVGAQPVPSFVAVIEEEMAKAQALVRSGTPKSKVYAAAIAKAGAPAKSQPASAGAAKGGVDIPIPRGAPTRGPANAKVVIQEFANFQCPFSARVQSTLSQILRDYGGKVRVVWRDYPLPMHQFAPLAAQAAREVYAQKGNRAFWRYHDILFANQRSLSRADLERYAQQLGGINMQKFRAALDNGTHAAEVNADVAAVERAGLRIGTPSFLINGKLVQGAQPYPAFKAEIDAALR